MKEPVRYTGPYTFKSGKVAGRQFMVVYYSDGSKGTTLYSRYLYQKEHGVILDKDTTVDHIDENKDNDSIDNLQPMSREENARKSAILQVKEMFKFNCPICGVYSEKEMRDVRHNHKQGKAGPFCSRQCARKWQIAGMPELVYGKGLNPFSLTGM